MFGLPMGEITQVVLSVNPSFLILSSQPESTIAPGVVFGAAGVGAAVAFPGAFGALSKQASRAAAS